MTERCEPCPEVNVWIVLFDDRHLSSDRDHHFINRLGVKLVPWPVVKNAAVGVMRSPHYSRQGGLSIQPARPRSQLNCNERDHAFWDDGVSLRDDSPFNFARVQGHNRITDFCLTALAVQHKGRQERLDQSIALSNLHGANVHSLLMLWWHPIVTGAGRGAGAWRFQISMDGHPSAPILV